MSGAVEEIKLKIEGMHCVSCVKNIEDILKNEKGVMAVTVDFATSFAYISYDSTQLNPSHILQMIAKAGYQADRLENQMTQTSTAIARLFQNPGFVSFMIAALLTFPLLLQMGVDGAIAPWIQWVLATIVQFWSGKSFYRGAYYSLKAKSFNMDVLIALGSSCAYLYSLILWLIGVHGHLYFETSAAIITIVLLGRWMEGATKHQATMAIEKLLLLRPKKVQVERENQLMEVSPDEVLFNELFYVRPGESVAVDGKILVGTSTLDESLLTGESVPVLKMPGDWIYAGTLNQSGLLKAKGLLIGESTRLAQIIQLVEKLHLSKAPIQRLADRVSSIFVPSVLGIALFTFLVWWLFFHSLTSGILASIATIVIACPCALGIATPLVILIASAKAADCGFVFQDAASFERAAKIDTVLFDKTGTITKGSPEVEEVIVTSDLSEEELIQIAASIEFFSQHPLSKSFVNLARKKGIDIESVKNMESIAGKGIKASKRGVDYWVGSGLFAKECEVEIPKIGSKSSGATEIFLWKQHELLGIFFVKDPIRENSKQVVEALKKRNIQVYLMSGDKQENVKAVADEVGIDHYLAEILPDQKAKEVMRLKKEGHFLAMIGDGMNDAPALAASDVGFSIGSGSDIAIHASDATLIHNNLMNVVEALDLSKKSISKIKQNLFLAFAYNALAIPLAAIGWLNPMIAALAMVLSSISVVFNSLSLKNWMPKIN